MSSVELIASSVKKRSEEIEDDEESDNEFSSRLAIAKLLGSKREFSEEYTFQEIVPSVFLGPKDSAMDRRKLWEKNISHILIVGAELRPYYPEEFTYLQIDINDHETVNLIEHFPKCFEFIEKGIQSGGVLIHCAQGISRSASICIAYYMTKNKLGYDHSFNFVKSKRPCIFPNSGFVQQLRDLEKQMGL